MQIKTFQKFPYGKDYLRQNSPENCPYAGELLVVEVAEDLSEGVGIAEVAGVVVANSVHPHRATRRAQQV